jgi:hypothetical protein
MRFNRQEVFDYLGYSKWQCEECNDPIGMLGKKVPSFHCKGKKEQIIAVRFSQVWQFRAVCDCGWGYEREVGDGFIGFEWSPHAAKLAERDLKELEKIRKSWPAKQQKNYEKMKERMRAGTEAIYEQKLKSGDLSHVWISKVEAAKVPATVKRKVKISTESLLRNPWNVPDILERRKTYTKAQKKKYGLL